jgi:hypothetical protein
VSQKQVSSPLHHTLFILLLTHPGLFPGVNYYLSCWYKRSEFGIRAAIFFSAAALAGSFGGLLAAGIAQMKGIGGKPGWAWIFVRPTPPPPAYLSNLARSSKASPRY